AVEAVVGREAGHASHGAVGSVRHGDARVDAEAHERVLAHRAQHEACGRIGRALVDPLLSHGASLLRARAPECRRPVPGWPCSRSLGKGGHDGFSIAHDQRGRGVPGRRGLVRGISGRRHLVYEYPGTMARTPSAAAAHIGSRIAAVRIAQSMTVDELAVASRIDSSNVRGYESGRSLMNVQSLVRIAEALQVSAGELL